MGGLFGARNEVGADGSTTSAEWKNSAQASAIRQRLEEKKARGEALSTNEAHMLKLWFGDSDPGPAGGAASLTPDLTDEKLKSRKMAQAFQLMSGRGRKQSFLGGDYANPASGGGSILGGG